MPDDINIIDDGLIIPDVGLWSLKKYELVKNYARIFSTSMKNKWDCRVYIDLYAGAGYSKIRDNSKIVQASPLLAIDIPDRFDKYIFCETGFAIFPIYPFIHHFQNILPQAPIIQIYSKFYC